MSNKILGIYNKAPRENKFFGFVKILGEHNGDSLSIGEDYEKKYPSVGEAIWLNPPANVSLYTIGFWDINNYANVDRSKIIYSEYYIENNNYIRPIEFISYPDISKPREVRELLLNGITLEYPPSKNTALIIANDTIVKLPELFNEDGKWKTNDRGLSQPLKCWYSLEKFKIVNIKLDSTVVVISSLFKWPDEDDIIDCASDHDKLTYVLIRANRLLSNDKSMSRSVRKEIVDDIVNIVDDPIFEIRKKYALNGLKRISLIEKEIEELLMETMDTNPFNEIKTKFLEEAKQKEIGRIKDTEKELVASIENLNQNVSKLKKEKSLIETQLKQLNKDKESIQKQSELIVDKIQERTRDAVKNSVDMLANISILKPFIGMQTAATGKSLNIVESVDLITNNVRLKEYSDINDLLTVLSANFKELGLSGRNSSELAAILIAIRMAGLYTTILSSNIRELTTALSAATFGYTPTIISIGAGLQNYSEIEKLIGENENGIVLLEDISNSPIEYYLAPLLRNYNYSQRFLQNRINSNNIDNSKWLFLCMDEATAMLSLNDLIWEYTVPLDISFFVDAFDFNTINFYVGQTPLLELLNIQMQIEINHELIDDLLDELIKHGVVLKYYHRKAIKELYIQLIKLSMKEQRAIEIITLIYLRPLAKFQGATVQLKDAINKSSVIENKEVVLKDLI